MLKTLINSERSKLNPQICNSCEEFGRRFQGGAEVEVSMLFVDVRGSTSIAERMSTSEYSRLLNRFYNMVTEKMTTANALIEKMIGDEVTGLFVPGIAGIDHARAAINAAREIVLAAGYGSKEEPWIPLGAGVHTGVAFVGSVGSKDGLTDIAALGDDVNIAARLTAQARPGEVIVSEKAWSMAEDLDTNGEIRELQLKGRSEPVKVRVLKF